ncbi:MAG: hypothetical protein H0U97_20380 [Gammaproteobacteria bacterium]|nr:hypothetical protein [Gammaproteobacteria bacterium]
MYRDVHAQMFTKNADGLVTNGDIAYPMLIINLLPHGLIGVMIQRGFFRIRDLSIRAEPISFDLQIPYGVGFYDAGGSVRLRVLDAVRGTFEGGKAQAFFHDWLNGEEVP